MGHVVWSFFVMVTFQFCGNVKKYLNLESNSHGAESDHECCFYV